MQSWVWSFPVQREDLISPGLLVFKTVVDILKTFWQCCFFLLWVSVWIYLFGVVFYILSGRAGFLFLFLLTSGSQQGECGREKESWRQGSRPLDGSTTGNSRDGEGRSHCISCEFCVVLRSSKLPASWLYRMTPNS